VENHATDFRIFEIVCLLYNKYKIISNFFLSEYTRKHDRISSNPNQKTPLQDFGIQLKSRFRIDLL